MIDRIPSWSESDYSDDFSDDSSSVQLDLEYFARSANRKCMYHKACVLGPARSFSLQLEAELNLANHDFESALVCAMAASILRTEERSQEEKFSFASPNDSPTDMPDLSLIATQTICMYQLGDRDSAVDLMERWEHAIAGADHVSGYLRKKFAATAEVLRFMPQLLSMLKMANRDE